MEKVRERRREPLRFAVSGTKHAEKARLKKEFEFRK
jgi:hypothetical protein